MKVCQFQSENEQEWNIFLEETKNSTFLFNRKFMDYHKQRFTDASIMVYNERNEVVACMPANISENGDVISHAGLTYGGLIIKREEKLLNVLEIFYEILKHFASNGIKKLILKDFPKFYNNFPSEEIEYVLFLANAVIFRRDTAIVIDQEKPIGYQTRRLRSIKKALKENVLVDETENFEMFWTRILQPNLNARHGVNPVHTLEEILTLKKAFPQDIILRTVSLNGQMMAGAVLFITADVVHAQYISASEEGRRNGSLDYLFDYLIKSYKSIRYFDFGICNENAGKDLNKGLLEWKEGFGGRTFCHNFYEIETQNHKLLTQILINH